MKAINTKGRWMIVLGLLAGCNEADFSGSNNIGQPKPTFEETAVPCDTANPHQTKHLLVETSEAGSEVKITGSFCAVGLDQTAFVGPHIAFLVDYSGSMNNVDPLRESCMRFEAAKALYESLEARFGDKMDKISFSLTTFEGNAQPASGGVISSQQFKDTYLNKETFCRSVNGATNYEAAFTVAHDSVLANLTNVQDKHVFMLTDGVPTMFGVSGLLGQCNEKDPTDLRCADAGAAAADKLSQLENLNLNVLFLINQSNQAESEKAKEYLETRITKNPDNVKFAGNAKQAADLIKEFEEPESKPTTDVDATAKVEGDLGAIPLVKLEDKGNGVWTFETIVLVPGRDATYVLKVVPTSGGSDLGMSTEVELEVVVVENPKTTDKP